MSDCPRCLQPMRRELPMTTLCEDCYSRAMAGQMTILDYVQALEAGDLNTEGQRALAALLVKMGDLLIQRRYVAEQIRELKRMREPSPWGL